MKTRKRGEKGFTLIELLIVVAILGVLAAVVIPNVGKFIGKGKTEAAATELANIQSAVISMMVDTNLATLPTGNFSTSTKINNMAKFPDPNGGADSTPPGGSTLFAWNDNSTVNYVVTQNTTKYYTANALGTVTQWDSP